MNVSHGTVVKYLERAQSAGLTWPLPDGLDEAEIDRLMFPAETRHSDAIRRMPDFEEVHRELSRKGVTLQLLWQEYKERNPEGYQYTQFCEHYRWWAERLDVSLRQEHRAGEKLFVDFAGKGIDVVDSATGEVTKAEIFVAVLGASNYTYAEALPSQSLPHWIGAHVRTFEYFGGVPEIVVPDNLGSGVTRACRYEPDLNATYNDMCQHYGTVAMPARVRKAKRQGQGRIGRQCGHQVDNRSTQKPHVLQPRRGQR